MMFPSYIYYYAGQNATNNAMILDMSTFSMITFIALIVSAIAILFAIFMLKDALNNYVFLGIVSTLITLIWFVMLSNSTVINSPDFYAVIPTITILIAVLAVILDIFVFYKTYDLNKKLKLIRNHVASIESEYKALTTELKNIENELRTINEKLDSAQKEIENQLTRIDVIRLYSW